MLLIGTAAFPAIQIRNKGYQMKKLPRQLAALAVSGALSVFCTAQAATVTECRAAVGFNSASGAWGAVATSSDYFLSRRTVGTCEVKVVGSTTKGKPPTSSLVLSGPMTQDECSLYNYLSSVDSKLNQAKVSDAYVTISNMVAKVGELFATGKLAAAGYETILPAAQTAQQCVYELMTAP